MQDSATITTAWMDGLAHAAGADPRRSGTDAVSEQAIDGTVRRIAAFLLDTNASFDSDETAQTLRHLGSWCARHGIDVGALLISYDHLARVLDGACLEWARAHATEPTPAEMVTVAGRLNRAPILMAAQAVRAYDAERAAHVPASDFTELLAHELATPINAAEIAAVLLENPQVAPGTQELRRLAGQIQRNLRRVRALLGDARDLWSAHAPDGHEEQFVPISQMLGEIVAELNPAAREASVRIDLEEPIPAALVPAARSRVVVRNLVSNAIKYADPSADVRWVRISFERPHDADGWILAVSDNGLGIPAQEHHRVFQRFLRLHPERADGTGLGLAIAAETAQKMKGRLDFVSEPGVGSTFRFWLPAPTCDPRGD